MGKTTIVGKPFLYATIDDKIMQQTVEILVEKQYLPQKTLGDKKNVNKTLEKIKYSDQH